MIKTILGSRFSGNWPLLKADFLKLVNDKISIYTIKKNIVMKKNVFLGQNIEEIHIGTVEDLSLDGEHILLKNAYTTYDSHDFKRTYFGRIKDFLARLGFTKKLRISIKDIEIIEVLERNS